MYQALYRKWRPRTFDDVVGQEQVTSALRRQVREGRVSHAYLFVGTRGTGKTTCAKILSRAVNCEHPVDGNPCNCCRSCLGIEDGSILDVEEIDAASNNGVDNIRALREEAVFTPAEVRKRIYIVDEVHMLSTSAFNALLKILEEPPEHLIFILATTELKKVPATILSRCQRYSFKRIPEDALQGRLEYVARQEGMELAEDAAALLSRLADGSLRDGLSLLDQCSGEGVINVDRVNEIVGLAGSDAAGELMEAVRDSDAARALELMDKAWRGGKDLAAVLGELSSLLRDGLILKVTGDGQSRLFSGFFSREQIRDCAKAFSTLRLSAALELLQNAVQEMGRSAAGRTVAELCVVRLCRGEDVSSLTLEERVAALEETLRSGAPIPAGSPGAPSDDRQTLTAPARREEPAPAAAQVPQPERTPLPQPEKTPAPRVETAAHPQPDPAPAPRAAAVPAPAAPDKTPSDGQPGWPEILQEARPELKRVAWSMLNNAAYLKAKLNGARLEIGVYAEQTLAILDQEANRAALASAVQRLTGTPAVVTFTLTTPQVEKKDVNALDKLLKLNGLG